MARATIIRDQVWLPEPAISLPVPPPALFWATLGVFRPGELARLRHGERGPDGEIRLRFDLPDSGSTLVYGVHGRQLRWIERRENDHAVERVELALDAAARFPRRATYRDVRAYRELRVELDTIEDVDSYPPDLWVPVP